MLLVAGLLAVWRLAPKVPLRVNLSDSIPIGLYRFSPIGSKDASKLKVGTIVLACLDRRWSTYGVERRYLGRGSCPGNASPIGKPIVATAGAIVGVTGRGVVVNGKLLENTRPMPHDHAGRVVEGIAPGDYVVERGYVWLVANHIALSWDSRYFGPVPISGVIGVLRPMLVVRRTARWGSRVPGVR